MTRKPIALALTVLFFAGLASSVPSEFEADSYYKTARVYYDSGDYENALRSAYRAREIYESLDNNWGISRCDNLIIQIESVLSKKQLADMYYNIAGDYYLEAKDDIEVLERAVDMAKNAKRIYLSIGGETSSSGVLKCEDIIDRALSKINDIVNQCIRDGDSMYQNAQSLFFTESYIYARNMALNASEKYLSCPYQRGIDRAASLLTSINQKIQEIRINAQASYDKAVQYRATGGSNDLCIEYAAAAQDLFQKIGDDDGYTIATALASKCSTDRNKEDEAKMRDAQELLDDAKALSIIPDCENATDRAEKAKAIYQEFYNEAYEEEKDLPTSLRAKMILYEAYISEVNALLKDIHETCTGKIMLQIADGYYRKSQEYYLENRLNEAIAYATQARNVYLEQKYYVGISITDKLISQINLRMKQREEAEAFMKSARAYYSIAVFQDALIDASKAKSIYNIIHDRDMVSVVDAFMEDIKDGANKLDKANGLYNSARGSFDRLEYRDAMPLAQQAYDLYTQVNYSLGIAESNAIILESREQIKIEDIKFRNTAIMIVIVVLVVGFLLVQFLRRKRSIETEYLKRRRDDEERVRRRDEEWSLRTEEKTKSKVEEELRKLVEEERDKVDDVEGQAVEEEKTDET